VSYVCAYSDDVLNRVVVMWKWLVGIHRLIFIYYFDSDDRTPEVFKEKIEAATQMRAVMGAERRPNCLIIDEIDGAAQVRRGGGGGSDWS